MTQKTSNEIVDDIIKSTTTYDITFDFDVSILKDWNNVFQLLQQHFIPFTTKRRLERVPDLVHSSPACEEYMLIEKIYITTHRHNKKYYENMKQFDAAFARYEMQNFHANTKINKNVQCVLSEIFEATQRGKYSTYILNFDNSYFNYVTVKQLKFELEARRYNVKIFRPLLQYIFRYIFFWYNFDNFYLRVDWKE